VNNYTYKPNTPSTIGQPKRIIENSNTESHWTK